jgi:AcrR family transcriptional regulator
MARPRFISDEQILDTVRTAALQDGPAFSLDQIAHTLSVSTPALLKRFGNRQKLMIAALAPKGESLPVGEIESGPSKGPLRPQLEALFAQIAASFSTTFPCVMVLRESGIPESEIWCGREGPPHKRMFIAMGQWLKRAKASGLVHAEELETAASAMLGAIISRIAMGHVLKNPMSANEQNSFTKDLASLFSRALKADEAVVANVSARPRSKGAKEKPL